MRRTLALAGSAAFLTVAAASPRSANDDPVLILGKGTLTCATWLASPADRREGNQWIWGFWTGINSYGTPGGSVGHSTDHLGITAEVAKVCEAEPSLLLLYASVRVYRQFELESR